MTTQPAMIAHRFLCFLRYDNLHSFQFLHIILKSYLNAKHCNYFFKLMKQHHPSSNENTIVLAQRQDSESNELLSPDHTSQNRQISDLTFYRSKVNKQKKISKKPDTIIQKLSIMTPHSYNHVHNFLNILSINEHTLKNPLCEESYFKSIFYVKSIQKVQLRKNAIILFTRSIENTLKPVQYLIERFRSFGDNTFFQLANSIDLANRLYSTTNFMPDLIKSYDGQPLSRFIEAMQQKAYICKVAPNKIVISRKLLELLGEDMELYGLKLCKYKTPLRQIISGENYYAVIKKSIENIGLVSEFLKKKITFEQLQSKTCIEFNENLYTRQQKKIYCKLRLYMPTPLINCFEVMEQLNETDDCDRYWKIDPVQRRSIDRECNEQRYLEAETLRHLIEVSDSMLVNNRKRLAGYQIKQ